jgi:serine/threonine-protein kinase
MSPEQVVGRPVDGRADIFSLGAVLYEMLTGFAPFFGGDLEAVLYQVINEMPAAPTTRNKSLPAAFDYIVAKALAKHPDDRYANARALAADLRNFREIRVPAEQAEDVRTLERRAIRRRKGDVPPPRETERTESIEAAAAPLSETAARIDAAPFAGSASPPAVESVPSLPAAREGGPRRRNVIFAGAAAVLLILAGTTGLVRMSANRTPQSQRVDNASTPEMPIRTRADKPAAIVAAEPSTSAGPAVESAAAPAFAAPVSPVRTAASTSPLKSTPARVALAVSPWGEVYVDGRKKGLSPPLTELRLAPGKHTIELRNSTFAPYAETVNVEANASLKIRHKFR